MQLGAAGKPRRKRGIHTSSSPPGGSSQHSLLGQEGCPALPVPVAHRPRVAALPIANAAQSWRRFGGLRPGGRAGDADEGLRLRHCGRAHRACLALRALSARGGSGSHRCPREAERKRRAGSSRVTEREEIRVELAAGGATLPPPIAWHRSTVGREKKLDDQRTIHLTSSSKTCVLACVVLRRPGRPTCERRGAFQSVRARLSRFRCPASRGGASSLGRQGPRRRPPATASVSR